MKHLSKKHFVFDHNSLEWFIHFLKTSLLESDLRSFLHVLVKFEYFELLIDILLVAI